MNASISVLSASSRELICDLVDNQCALNMSDQPRIVILAYCAVFLPWGFLALLDMINERWKTIRRVFIQGALQVVFAVPTIAYTCYYIELQRADRDYKEMCAALVAVCLSAFHFVRTAWGLWQAYWYWRWVKFCLNHFIQHGYQLDHIESEFQGFEEHHLSFGKRLNRLALSMRVNNSMIDNEFFECDVPFRFNWSRLTTLRKCFSLEEPWFMPQHFSISCLRYMVPFLAQFGRKWLRDCDHVKEILETRINDYSGVFSEANVVKYAEMLTKGGELKSNEERMAANWSNAWSTTLMYHETQIQFLFENRVPMPFGGKKHRFHVGMTYSRYGSKIKHLIDNLPEELFEEHKDGDDNKVKTIQCISAFHLESFLIFLYSKVLYPVNPVAEKPAKEDSSEPAESSRTEGEEAETSDTSYDSQFSSEPSSDDLETSPTNSAIVSSERVEMDENVSRDLSEREEVGTPNSQDKNSTSEPSGDDLEASWTNSVSVSSERTEMDEQMSGDLSEGEDVDTPDIQDKNSSSEPSSDDLEASWTNSVGVSSERTEMDEHFEDLVEGEEDNTPDIDGNEVSSEASNGDLETSLANSAGASSERIQNHDFYFETSRNNLWSSSSNLRGVSSERTDVHEQIAEAEVSEEESENESNTHSHRSGSNDKLKAVALSDADLSIDHHWLAWDRRSGIGISDWSFRSLVLLKLSASSLSAVDSSLSAVDSKWLRRYSETRLREFTIHLENVFAFGFSSSERGRERASDRDRESYYEELCSHTIRIFKISRKKKIIPICRSLKYYWRLWDLPTHVPPAVRDVYLKINGQRRGIKFIGYVMEIVRVCLAKWTERHVTDDMDAGIWSPEMRTEHAFLEFDSSRELSKLLLNYNDGFSRLGERICMQRIVWECQQHVLGVVEGGEREYGPSDIEIMILCMLGLPTLRVSSIFNRSVQCYEVEPIMYRPVWRPPAVRIAFTGFEENHAKIRVSIIPRPEGGASVMFEWATWIHAFEACMKALTYEYNKEDFRPVGRQAISWEGSGPSSSSGDGVEAKNANFSNVGDSVGQKTGTSGDIASMNSDANREVDMGRVSSGSPSRDKGGRDVSSQCSCGCMYRLNTKAERVIVEDRHGVKKYYWEWEGWKPQQAFKNGKYPIMYDLETPEDTHGSRTAGETEEHMVGEGDSGVANNAISAEFGFPNADEQV